MLVRPPSCVLVFPCEEQKPNAGIDVMTNAGEHAITRMFGLSLTAVFLGLLILNGISF
jgi:hypothetical protein